MPDLGAGSATGPSEDALLGGRVRLRQPKQGYRAAIDPVLLAAAVDAGGADRVLDMGAGSGAAMLCLARRVADCRIVGLELQQELAALADQNIRANGVQDRVRLVRGDLLDPPKALGEGGFDHVMANPPHGIGRAGTRPPDPGRAAAHVEGRAELADWVAVGLSMLRPRGAFTIIHRAERLDEILAELGGRAGEIVVFPLWPKAGAAAKRVIVRARKGARTPLRLSPGLALHNADGSFTAGAEAVLRDGAPLTL